MAQNSNYVIPDQKKLRNHYKSTDNLIGKASRSWHDGFNGTIRDVRVYSGARTVEQINADRFNAISADDSLVYGYDLVNSATSATNPSEVATIVGSLP